MTTTAADGDIHAAVVAAAAALAVVNWTRHAEASDSTTGFDNIDVAWRKKK